MYFAATRIPKSCCTFTLSLAMRCSPQLRGMFAFAIWDSPEKQLFLARDPYGIKPLYYAHDGSTLRFASQVKALMAGGAHFGVYRTRLAGLGFTSLAACPSPPRRIGKCAPFQPDHLCALIGNGCTSQSSITRSQDNTATRMDGAHSASNGRDTKLRFGKRFWTAYVTTSSPMSRLAPSCRRAWIRMPWWG